MVSTKGDGPRAPLCISYGRARTDNDSDIFVGITECGDRRHTVVAAHSMEPGSVRTVHDDPSDTGAGVAIRIQMARGISETIVGTVYTAIGILQDGPRSVCFAVGKYVADSATTPRDVY